MKTLASIGLATLWFFGMVWFEATKMLIWHDITFSEYSSLGIPIIGFVGLCCFCRWGIYLWEGENNETGKK